MSKSVFIANSVVGPINVTLINNPIDNNSNLNYYEKVVAKIAAGCTVNSSASLLAPISMVIMV